EIHKERKIKHIVLKLYFTSCSFRFIEKLHIKLSSFGINGGCIYKSKNKQFCRLQYSTENALKIYNFMYNSNVDDLKGLYLKRKKQVFEKYMRLRL
ncbi:MAG: hypothetical protein WCJ59_03030, partial [bacterium]